MVVAVPVVVTVLVLGAAVLAARSTWARKMDASADRVFESRGGLLIPGGIFWRMGNRQASSKRRYWPLIFGVGNWVLYEKGRQASQRREVDPPGE